MTRTWFSERLETVATFWRILRTDGVALGFTTHDRDLWFDGLLHRASPGMVPSAIRRSADLEPDSVEVHGAITHDAVTGADLAAGRFDGAHVRIGLVDWETGEHAVLHDGTIGSLAEEDGAFVADLDSHKARLWRDPVPRISPACRAAFCGPGCNLNPARFTQEVRLVSIDPATNAARFEGAANPSRHAGGSLRWLGGRQIGITMGVMGPENDAAGDGALVLDAPIDPQTPPGTRAWLREGCDHTLETCADRFGNAVNFQGEPFLPGNDMLTRYPGAGIMTRADVAGVALAHAARALVGTPFRLHGRDPRQGLDCVGVLEAALASMPGRARSLPNGYTLRMRTLPDFEAIASRLELTPAGGPVLAGNVLMLHPAPCQLHLAIAADAVFAVHAHAGLRKVVLGALPPDWPVLGRWRLDPERY